MHNKSMLRLLIIEDEALIAEDIKDICELSGFKAIQICYSGKQAISLITNKEFDLAIIDINLNTGYSGFDIADFINLQQKKLPYIFLTSYSDNKTLQRAKDYKPLAYITKPFRKEQLVSTLEIVFMNYYDSKLHQDDQINRSSLLAKLSTREFEIANLIFEGKSTNQIANKLCLSTNTIKFHLKKIYEKLEIENRIQLIKILGN